MTRTGRASTPPELQELRDTLDAQLGALEAALADPQQHSSLEQLILELARLATEEAEATARLAVGAVRTEGLSALEAERAVAASFRQAVEEAQAELQTERGAAVAMRQQLVDVRQQLADMQQQLTATNQAHEQEQAERATFKRELENALGLLKTERARSSSLEQAVAQANSHADAARAALATHDRELAAAQQAVEAELRTNLSAAQQQLEGMRRDAEARSSTLSGSQSELEQAQARAAEADARAEQARARAEEEQARAAEAIRERDSLKEKLETAGSAASTGHSAAPSSKYEELLQSSEQRIRSLELALRDAETRAEAAECELELQRRAAAPKASAHNVPTSDPASAPAEALLFPGPARAAKRVSIVGELEIEVEGAPARLIDVSLTGAQILASTLMKPNRLVRLSLPSGGKTVICKGKVMWSQLEPRSGELWYRAGVLFTTADRPALEAFLDGRDSR